MKSKRIRKKQRMEVKRTFPMHFAEVLIIFEEDGKLDDVIAHKSRLLTSIGNARFSLVWEIGNVLAERLLGKDTRKFLREVKEAKLDRIEFAKRMLRELQEKEPGLEVTWKCSYVTISKNGDIDDEAFSVDHLLGIESSDD